METSRTIPGIRELLGVVEQITESVRSGHHVWGGGVGASSVLDEVSGEWVYEVASPDEVGEDLVRRFEDPRDAAWDLLRRSGGVLLTVEPLHEENPHDGPQYAPDGSRTY